MTWWAWTLLWVVLVVGSLFFFFLIGRSLWRKASAFLVELGEASDRLSAVSAELGMLAGQPEPGSPEPAVFADPLDLRQQRVLARRRRTVTVRRRALR